jgi:CRP-like cAMP-binding protein
MAINDTVQILARVPFLSSLGHEELRLLAFAAEPMRIPPGRTLARQGDSADAAYVLVSGTLASVTAEGATLKRFSEPSTLVGELALIVETQWQAGFVADSEVEVLRLPRAQFRRLLDDYPDVADAIRRRIAEDVSRLADAMGPVSGKF